MAVTDTASRGSRGERGFADVWWKGKFAWEYKRKGKYKDLTEAYRQLCQYREALENPPLLIVSDIARTEIHTNFTGTKKELHPIELAELDKPESLDLLRRVFTDPDSFKPTVTTEAVTREVARQFAELARAMLDAPDTETLAGYRDRALLLVGFQAGPRRSKIAHLTVRGFCQNVGLGSLRVHRKGEKKGALAINPQTAQRIRAYLDASGHAEDLNGPLFRRLRNNGEVNRSTNLGRGHQAYGPGRHRPSCQKVRQANRSRPRLFNPFDACYVYHDGPKNGARFEDVRDDAGHANASAARLYDKRGYDPEKSASFFADC